MSQTLSNASQHRAPRGPWRTRAAIAAVVLVPLAFAGLFVGSLSEVDNSLDNIPAAIVNSDELVNQTAPDGTETPVFAGRQLVTELTGDSEGFDWAIANAEDARTALDAGDVYAVLTVPKNFSASILSLQSDDPKRAELSIRTDDAHGYLAGAVAESVGSGMVSTFGQVITSQYIAGIYSSIGGLGEALDTAAGGASELASGITGLGSGLDELSIGATAAQSGATDLARGVATYTGGVSSLSGGLEQLRTGSNRLTGITDGVATFTGGISQLAAGIAEATSQLNDTDLSNDDVARGSLAALSAQLSGAAVGGDELAAQATGGIQGVQGGIAQSASGAARLASGSGALTSGADSLAGGLGDLATGAAGASSGAIELATGATDLASGLREGADQVPSMDTDAGAATAEVAADPVNLVVDRENGIPGIGQVIATFFVPLGLWIGALAIFLVIRPVSRPALSSTARNGRVVFATLAKGGAIAIAQALLLVALLHVAVGVEWMLLPGTLAVALVMALAFTAFHYLLTVWFGRAGLVISLFALAVQVTSTGGIYPVQLLAGPFQAISPLLPLTYGVSGMQAILAGGNGVTVVVAVVTLLAFGVASVLLSFVAVRKMRRVQSLGMMTA